MTKPGSTRLFAAGFGLLLTLTGLLGFFVEGSFGTGDSLRTDEILAILPVNGWVNLLHLLSGLLGLVLAGSLNGSRHYAAGLGGAYLLIAGLGMAGTNPGTLLSILPINNEENILHLVIGGLGIAAFLAERPDYSAPSTKP